MIGASLSHYRVTAAIGAGGMGEVFRARDTKLDRDVAIKVLPAELARDRERLVRFEREAKLLASLNHSNIAHVYGFESATLPDGSNAHFLVMELVEGEDLSERLKGGAIPVDESIAIAKQIAEGLEEAHEHGIIHRDLKPANVKVTPDGKAKVLDFGLAKAMEGDPSASAANSQLSHSPTMSRHMTEAGMIMGTAAYMSPEQARGKAVDKRADIWSFGVVLFEMLSGTRLFAGETVSDTLAAVLTRDPDWAALPASTPGSVRDLIGRCLDRDATMRLRDIGEARLALQRPRAIPESGPSPSVKMRPARWAAAGVIAGVLATALFAGLWGRPTQEPTDQPRVRFELTLPPAAELPAGTGSTLAVSPDGRSIVFVAGPPGARQLWLRAIDASGARPLPGTDGGYYPFWSADNAFVGFFADRKLKRVEVATGNLQTICPVTDEAGGGTWNRDGVIVFSPKLEGPLFRVAATGGTPAPLTALDPANRESNHVFPAFLPDGRHYLFTGLAGMDRGVYAGALDSDKRTVLIRSQTQDQMSAAGYSAGHLLYALDGQLVARAFDAGTLALKGDAFPLADGMGQINAGRPPFGASPNGVLVFRTAGGRRTIQPTWVGRDGARQGTLGPPDHYGAFDLSPDGQTLALDRFTDRDVSIWLVDTERGTSTRFTTDTYSSGPLWSPEGDRLVFSSPRGTPPNPFVRTLAGVETRLATLPENTWLTSWGPRGDVLIGSFKNAHTGRDLWIFSGSEEKAPRLFLQTAANEFRGDISPDGRFVAFTSDESGNNEIYVSTFPEAGRRMRVSTNGGDHARWRDDGNELFLESGGKVMASSVATATAGESENGSIGLRVGTPHALFDLPEAAFWIPAKGGQRFLVGVPTAKAEPAPIEVMLNWAARGGR